jgi:hypothetical protein
MQRFALALVALAACTEPPATASAGDAPSTGEASKPAGKGSTPATRNQVDPDGVVRRGKTLSNQDTLTVAQAYAKAGELTGKTVKIEGTVKKACSAKGCWMSLEGDEAGPPIRVTAFDYGFFVPKDSPGMAATVEGRFEVKELSVEKAQHYEDDRVAGTDEAPRKIEAPVLEGALVAQGLELRPPEPRL